MKPVKKNKRGDRGFTLVEIMVSVGIFSLAIIVIGQLFFNAQRAYRILPARSQAIDELSYDLEHISRGLRMAKKAQDFSCLSLLPKANYEKTASGIKFQNLNENGSLDCVEYYLGHPGGVYGSNGALMERRSGATQNFNLPLTSPQNNVLSFSVADGTSGWGQNDALQPRVTLYLQIKDKEGFVLENQVTISQRDLDITE